MLAASAPAASASCPTTVWSYCSVVGSRVAGRSLGDRGCRCRPTRQTGRRNTACSRLATRAQPLRARTGVMATTDGTQLLPDSSLSTRAAPACTTATAELLVPRSTPTTALRTTSRAGRLAGLGGRTCRWHGRLRQQAEAITEAHDRNEWPSCAAASTVCSHSLLRWRTAAGGGPLERRLCPLSTAFVIETQILLASEAIVCNHRLITAEIRGSGSRFGSASDSSRAPRPSLHQQAPLKPARRRLHTV